MHICTFQYSNTLEYGGKYGADDQNGADTQYRILADHARMVAVAIADNVYPDERWTTLVSTFGNYLFM